MYVWVLQRTKYNCFSVLLVITIQNAYVCDDLWSYNVLEDEIFKSTYSLFLRIVFEWYQLKDFFLIEM